MKDYPGLCCVRTLLSRLDEESIQYCHWKSNEHLEAAVLGETDLDILFGAHQRSDADKLLQGVGLVAFRAVWYRRYDGIEDYVGVDPGTARVTHVHAHFKLVLGEKGIKNYHLPWEKKLLGSRVWDDQYGIYRADPCLELLLLLIREAIKEHAHMRRHPRDPRAHGANGLLASRREFAWLQERTSVEALSVLGEELIGRQTIRPLASIWEQGLGADRLAQLYEAALPALQHYQRLGLFRAQVVRCMRPAASFSSRALRRLGWKNLPSHRVILGEGIIVAVIGADGSGKSSVSSEIVKHLRLKVDVAQLYMGSGKGQRGVLRRLLKLLPVRVHNTQGYQGAWRLAIAWEKRRRLDHARRAKRRGLVVVCDRYPQTTIRGFNDGPSLSTMLESRSWLRRLAARWELSCYRKALDVAPDLVIRLLAPPAVLAARRTEIALEALTKKQDGIRRLPWPQSTVVRDLDARHRLDAVVTEALRLVGEVLSHQQLNEPRDRVC